MEELFRPSGGKLGFGFMRLPKLEDGSIDLETAGMMTDMYLASGFRYFDTAWAYNGSEEALRKVLTERYPRNRFFLATKNAAWLSSRTREEALEQFQISLQRTGAGYFDCYLFHNLGDKRTDAFDRFDLWNWARDRREQGSIRNFGFSFHGTADQLNRILDDHPDVDFVQLQINYTDWENPVIQSRANYETAVARGIPVIVMEPVKGGMLAAPPEPVAKVFRDADPDIGFAAWALRFAANLEGTAIVLSGMSTPQQMAENIAALKNFRHLTPEQHRVIDRAREAFAHIRIVPCTNCNYCAKVCPQHIGISGTFIAANYIYQYQNYQTAAAQEKWFVLDKGLRPAVECVKCGLCETVCPQHIGIRHELEAAAQLLGKK